MVDVQGDDNEQYPQENYTSIEADTEEGGKYKWTISASTGRNGF